MAKLSKPIQLLVVVGVVAGAVLFFTQPDDSPAKTTKKPASKKLSSSLATDYVPADFTAKFASLNQTPRNAFKPLIVRNSSLLRTVSPRSNGVPGAFTGGDPNWAYTGCVEVNGEKLALLENSKSGDGVYLRKGDHWKSSLIRTVSEEGLIIVSSSGTVKKIQLGDRGTDPEEEQPVETEVVPVQVQPVQPTTIPTELQGAIGLNLSGRPGQTRTKKG